MSEDLADAEDFLPNEESVLEAEEGGSSEDDLDDEEEANPPTEAEIAEVNLESADSIVSMLKNAPPALAETYKKRFPIFWRMQQGLRYVLNYFICTFEFDRCKINVVHSKKVGILI